MFFLALQIDYKKPMTWKREGRKQYRDEGI